MYLYAQTVLLGSCCGVYRLVCGKLQRTSSLATSFTLAASLFTIRISENFFSASGLRGRYQIKMNLDHSRMVHVTPPPGICVFSLSHSRPTSPRRGSSCSLAMTRRRQVIAPATLASSSKPSIKPKPVPIQENSPCVCNVPQARLRSVPQMELLCDLTTNYSGLSYPRCLLWKL